MTRNANGNKLIGKEFQCIVARSATVSESGDQSAEDLLNAYL
jgi:hypothetical protein